MSGSPIHQLPNAILVRNRDYASLELRHLEADAIKNGGDVSRVTQAAMNRLRDEIDTIKTELKRRGAVTA